MSNMRVLLDIINGIRGILVLGRTILKSANYICFTTVVPNDAQTYKQVDSLWFRLKMRRNVCRHKQGSHNIAISNSPAISAKAQLNNYVWYLLWVCYPQHHVFRDNGMILPVVGLTSSSWFRYKLHFRYMVNPRYTDYLCSTLHAWISFPR